MSRSKPNRAIRKMMKNNISGIRDPKHIDKSLGLLFTDPLYEEHLEELHFKTGMNRESIAFIMKHFLTHLSYAINAKVKFHTRICLPGYFRFQIHINKKRHNK